MSEISREDLQELISPVISFIGNKTVDTQLETELNTEFPADSAVYQSIKQACHDAIKAGWMCKYEADGIRFGRVLKPSDELNGFSVDVVDMKDIRGPHHRHPNGEIDMVMPIDTDAKFDGKGAGWKVYQAGTAHYPSVAGGRALVLYLLPDGVIEFTGK